LSASRPKKTTQDKLTTPESQSPETTGTQDQKQKQAQPDSQNEPPDEIDPELQDQINQLMKE
jgi:hypothetical protein